VIHLDPMDAVLSVSLLAGFAVIVALLVWRTTRVFWPYLLPLVLGLLLTVAGYVVLGGLILLFGLFGGAYWLDRKRLDYLVSRRRRRAS
jgi:hypothetical protein